MHNKFSAMMTIRRPAPNYLHPIRSISPLLLKAATAIPFAEQVENSYAEMMTGCYIVPLQ
jgi:hypothetical protein